MTAKVEYPSMGVFHRVFVFWLISLLTLAARAGVPEIRRPESVAPGSRGVCVTELPGGELARIPLTVLAYQSGAVPGGDMLLVRLDDPRFEKTGILAGMSGSPVYVGGKLLGALAFAWQFSKAPIAGVTPFVRMLSIGQGNDHVAHTGSPAQQRPELDELAQAWNDSRLGQRVLDWLAPGRRPARGLPALAVSLGGGPVNGWLSRAWKRLGWVASASSGEAAAPAPGGDVEPGAMIAAVLVDGDATVAAGGTVTEIRGSQVWAFGHPFLGTGRTRIPMAAARVTALLPSLSSSFKFFATGREIGAIEADRSRGIWGRLGEKAPMLPVHVQVDGQGYDYRIVPDRTLAPLLAAYLTQSSMTARGRSLGDQTVQLSIGLDYGPDGGATFRESFLRPDAPARAAALAAAVLGYMEASPFPAPALKKLDISVRSEETVRKIEILEAVPERKVLRPGETVRVRLRLRRFGREDQWRTETIQIPPSSRPGPMDLVVGDGDAWTLYDLGARPFRPASFRDDLELLGRYIPASTLVLALERRDTGAVLDGGTVAVPPDVALSLAAGLGGALKTSSHRVVARKDIDLGAPASGGFRIGLTVREDGLGKAGQEDS